MRRGLRARVEIALLSITLLIGCGGGGAGGGGQTPPPPAPDFTVAFSSASLNLTQGTSSSPVTITLTPLHGFTGSAQITLASLPDGVTTSPASPFSVSAADATSFVVGAATNAAIGQFSLTGTATSGTISHTIGITLTVQQVSVPPLPKSYFVRDDSVPRVDQPPGEPHRRHLAYDSGGARLFVANRAMNRVEVVSGGSISAMIDAPDASGVDLSPDGATLWVGSATEMIRAIDTRSLQVTKVFRVAGLTPVPGTIFNRPTEVLAVSSGKCYVRLRQPVAAESLLALWDPGSNSFANLSTLAPGVFQAGLGPMARSGDASHMLAAAADASGEVAAFDAAGNLVAGPAELGSGSVSIVAANADGSRYAVALAGSNGAEVVLLSSSLSPLATYSTISPSGVAFSSDGQSVFVAEAYGNGRVISALDASTLQLRGRVSDLSAQGIPTAIELAASQLLYGVGNRGIGVLDVSQPGTLAFPAPNFSNVPVASPSEGPNIGGTTLTLSGSNFTGNCYVRFGTQNPVPAQIVSAAQIQLASPPSATPGPSDLVAYFTSGWAAVAPAAFSYAPSVLKVLPNAASKSGGDTLTLYGFGFGVDPSKVSVQIGAQMATVQKIDSMPAAGSSLGLDSGYPLPLERITLTVPAGAPGAVSITVKAPSGSATLSNAFQYLSFAQAYSHPGLYKFVLYDAKRQFAYLSATDHVDIFDLQALAFRSPLQPPPLGPPPDAALRGLALTSDQSQLVVADFGAQSVYLIDPDGAAYNGTKVPVGGVSGYLNSGPARVATTSDATVFVGMSGEGSSTGGCNSCLGQMNIAASPPSYQPAPQPEVSSVVGAPLLQADASGENLYLTFGVNSTGPVAVWSSSTPGVFDLASAENSATDLTTAGDGTYFALRSAGRGEVRDATLALASTPASPELEMIPSRVYAPGITMHSTGALFYEPFLDGPAPAAPPALGVRGGVDIRDAISGQLRMRVYLPEAFAMLNTDLDGLHGGFLAIDDTGVKLLAATTSGFSLVELAKVPLGVGSLSPASASAGGGMLITVRGSGFVSGTQATLGSKSVAVTVKDANTLTFVAPALPTGMQALVLSNPGGESVTRQSAYRAE